MERRSNIVWPEQQPGLSLVEMRRKEPQPASGTARSGHCFSKGSTLKDTQGVNLKASETAPNALQKALNSSSPPNHQKLLFTLCKQRENQGLVWQLEAAGVGQRHEVPHLGTLFM